tara:strand:- start:75 stop:506 length:432 start_codon:yes stop_codon:yes gene_type:complete
VDLKDLEFRLEVLKGGLQEGHLVDLRGLRFRLEDLKEGLQEGHLAGRLEGLLGLEPLQQAVRSEGLLDLKILQGFQMFLLVFLLQLVLVLEVLVPMALRFHPLLRMPHRASIRVLPLQPLPVLVLQMFSCRPWSSLTTPYLAA